MPRIRKKNEFRVSGGPAKQNPGVTRALQSSSSRRKKALGKLEWDPGYAQERD